MTVEAAPSPDIIGIQKVAESRRLRRHSCQIPNLAEPFFLIVADFDGESFSVEGPVTAKLCKAAIGGWSLQKISVGFPTIRPAGPKGRLFGRASRAGGWRRHRWFRK